MISVAISTGTTPPPKTEHQALRAPTVLRRYPVDNQKPAHRQTQAELLLQLLARGLIEDSSASTTPLGISQWSLYVGSTGGLDSQGRGAARLLLEETTDLDKNRRAVAY